MEGPNATRLVPHLLDEMSCLLDARYLMLLVAGGSSLQSGQMEVMVHRRTLAGKGKKRWLKVLDCLCCCKKCPPNSIDMVFFVTFAQAHKRN